MRTSPAITSPEGSGTTDDAPSPTRPAWKESLVLFGVALGLRLLYVGEMHDSPLWSAPFGIAAYDHSRALAILQGGEASGVFYHAALYAYFLAAVYSVFGVAALPVRLLQAALGALTCVLLAGVGTRLIARRVGLLAGFLLAVYPPAILLDGVLQKATLGLFLLVLLLLVLARSTERPRPPTFLLAGVVLGLLSMGRENAIVLVPVLLLWIWFSARELESRARLAGVLAFALGAALPMLAAGVRNQVVAGDFVPGASNAGASLFIGNRAGASGLFDGLVPGRGIAVFDPVDARRLAEADAGRPLRASEVNRYWLKRTLDEVRAAPFAWLALLAKKTYYLANAKEWAGAYDLQAFRKHSVLLRILGVPFRYGVVVAFGLAGLVLAWPTRKKSALLYVVLGALSLSVVLTFVDPRFRLSLVPLLLLFASCTLLQLIESVRERNLGAFAGLGVAVLLLLGVVHMPTGVDDWSESSTYNKLGLALANEGRREEALAMYLRALEAEPGNPSAHFNAGAALLDRGEYERGLEHLEAAARLQPDFHASVSLELGLFWAESGDYEQAHVFLIRARELDPLAPDVHFNLGLVLRLLERWEEAEPSYRAALRLDPGHVDARNNLAYLLERLGRKAEAIAEYEAALERKPDFMNALVNLAWLLATDAGVRDGPAALGYARRAHDLEPSHRTAAVLAAALAACGEFEEAVRVAEEMERGLRAAGEEELAEVGAGYVEAYRAGRVWTVGG